MKRLPYVAFALWFLLLAAVPFLASNYFVKIATFLAMYAALALSWNFIGGYTGYPSFSTAAFFGLGAYTGALLQNAGLWVGLAWACAAVVTTVFAAVIGFAILRMRGHYFAIGSIALVEALMLVASILADLTGGGEGLNVKIMPGGPDYIGRVFLYTMLGIMLAAFITTVLVDRGRLGFGLRCIQQNEDAADMVGIDTRRYKTAAFALSAVFCGAIGAAYASWVAYISPSDSFSILLTLKVPVMVLLGGPGTIFGPIVGSAAFVMMEETIWSKYLEYHQAVLGLVIVLLIFFLPGGVLRVFRRRAAA
ncbi:MAG TPA: branched-chain amino acid ABC transporter permease [Burkholderiales bacterium]|nr:branched-chain amino acid ABC transporter permease [Burkholderiales bacterium]